MGQKNTSEKLFEQYKSKPSNRARDQIWTLYHEPKNASADDIVIDTDNDNEVDSFVNGSKEFLTYAQSKDFLLDLFDYLREIDSKRERSFRTWDDKEKIVMQWLVAFGSYKEPETLEKMNEVNDEQKELIEEGWELVKASDREIDKDTYRITKKDFYYALKQIEVENKIEKYQNASLLEENWDIVEADEKVSEKAVDELTLKQISTLLKNGDSAFSKGQHRIAHKKYQLALNIIESYLFDLPSTSSLSETETPNALNETLSSLKKQLFLTKRKMEKNLFAEEELIEKTSGTMKNNSKTLEALPVRGLYLIMMHLTDDSKVTLKICSKFFQNAVYCIAPLLRNSDSNVNWKNLNICLQMSERFSILNYLFPEIKIQIFSELNFNDRLQIRAVSKGLKGIVDELLKAEFESMHFQNFSSLQNEIVTIGEGSYSEQAVEVTGVVGLSMMRLGGEMARAAGGMSGAGIFALVYLGITLGVVAVGGVLYLESAVGGPISGSIGKAVELVEVGMAQSDKLSNASFCHQCDREISFFDKKWACRACRATFCNSCKYNDLVILVAQKKTSFNIKLCDKCHKLIDTQYDQQKSILPKKEDDEEDLHV